MKMKTFLPTSILALALASAAIANDRADALSGDYLEVRTCDVYTGPCFANAEVGLDGMEGMLVWSVREGSWKGVQLDGLSVIAVLRVNGTLGDISVEPRRGAAMIIVDQRADERQRQALESLARTRAAKLIREVASVRVAEIDAQIGGCTETGCASVKAGNLVAIKTRCLCEQDHLCGNEEVYYPPLTKTLKPVAAYTEIAALRAKDLGVTFESTNIRSAFLGSF